MPPVKKASGKLCRDDRVTVGRGCRKDVPRAAHAEWKPPKNRRDPISILAESNKGRLQNLIPIRYGRMAKSPFTFLRGSAAVMASDLANTPTTGIEAQLCGDCHLSNFGLFATPERHLVFDVNDFDETHPGPWEWDLKRLATSFVVAARDNKFSEAEARNLALQVAHAYREHVRECAAMAPMDVWYQRMEWQTVIDELQSPKDRKLAEAIAAAARKHVIEHLYPKIARSEGGHTKLVDQPPMLYHVDVDDMGQRVREALAQYRQTLPDDRRVLFDRYHLVDFAVKVVGIGSVGTRCYILLMMSVDNDPLILQVKQARRSVIEPYTRKSRYENQGERVVVGQRLMQSSSDIFLGWMHTRRGRDYYVRQLRDMKFSAPLDRGTPPLFRHYANLCGWTLARAHARSGDAAAISGYLGKSERFDEAIAKFAAAYADQTERDHAELVKAIRSGRLESLSEE
ncbi:MAG TPA: DUF2252 domain-containing protein [Usitatibacter sp.]|nr:DUF2252 domain-containing protein [Usitatibacter sp.]